MSEILERIVDQFHQNWIKFAVAGTFALVGWYLGFRKAQRLWSRREFLDRLNVSLNSIQDGRLVLRTLMEKRCEEIFLNQAACRAVITASQKTTSDDPLLKLPESDYWYFLNAILNEISEKFATGAVRKDLGAPVTCAQYVMCLTCEIAPTIRQKKIRVMVVRKDLLENLPEEAPAFDSPNHSTRWKTLQQMAVYLKSTPERFLTMEICQ
jgi:hypothetical protein